MISLFDYPDFFLHLENFSTILVERLLFSVKAVKSHYSCLNFEEFSNLKQNPDFELILKLFPSLALANHLSSVPDQAAFLAPILIFLALWMDDAPWIIVSIELGQILSVPDYQKAQIGWIGFCLSFFWMAQKGNPVQEMKSRGLQLGRIWIELMPILALQSKEMSPCFLLFSSQFRSVKLCQLSTKPFASESAELPTGAAAYGHDYDYSCFIICYNEDKCYHCWQMGFCCRSCNTSGLWICTIQGLRYLRMSFIFLSTLTALWYRKPLSVIWMLHKSTYKCALQSMFKTLKLRPGPREYTLQSLCSQTHDQSWS